MQVVTSSQNTIGWPGLARKVVLRTWMRSVSARWELRQMATPYVRCGGRQRDGQETVRWVRWAVRLRAVRRRLTGAWTGGWQSAMGCWPQLAGWLVVRDECQATSCCCGDVAVSNDFYSFRYRRDNVTPFTVQTTITPLMKGDDRCAEVSSRYPCTVVSA